MLLTLTEIVENGLCIGCGLCRSIAGPDQVELVMTPEGRERPVARRELGERALAKINAVCPGTRIGGPDPAVQTDDAGSDTIWGRAARLSIGYASDPAVRFRGSTGGVLTALGQFLLASGRVKFILHVAASRSAPMRSERRLSFDSASVLEGAGSRYGPAAPLMDFCEILERGEPFALIAKPCDITAARSFARIDHRVERQMRYALTLVCGGASDLAKSEEVLERFGVSEEELALFRYRGFGNPGPTRLETKDGRAFELTYQQLWEDEAKWMIQPRCKICADAIGQGADIAASDVWPGGGPTGEDDGFNGIIVRTRRGLELYEAAVAAGVLTIERSASFADFDLFQPHQLRKRRAVWARLKGMEIAGKPVPQVTDLGLENCARQNSLAENLGEARGARERAKRGRLGEPRPVPRAAG
ncbi:MAG TPA: Coenzyme F420 hydrogenase/dehydrogenase, beta subunit C-terminal domain [Dongiaceae bacterium]|nr:Coenzyme F420 hydrogenase/dehydrogenase, beta subunit C-terminal domain [Dongiaceae bacterium]